MLKRRSFVTTLTIVVTLGSGFFATDARSDQIPLSAREAPLEIGFRKQLLVDDYIIAEKSNVRRALGQVTKANGGHPLIVADKPWERADLFRLGSVLHDGRKFRMWYGMNEDSRGAWLGYAESEDGLHWTKPNLGLQEHQGSKNNNIVNIGEGMGHMCYLDPHETDPAHKYKAAYGPAKPPYGACLAHSSDGFHWTAYNDGRPVTHRASDTYNKILWDEEAQVYRLYTRTDFGRGLYGGTLEEDRGTRDMTNPDVKADPANWTRIREWHFDREGKWEYKRRQAHHLIGWIYEGTHFGLLGTYEWVDQYKLPGREVMNFYIVTTHGDDIWDLSWVYEEKPLIPRGPEGSFDAAWVQIGSSIVTWKGKHWMYYGGDDGNRECTIGLATLPLDRFVGLEAQDQLASVLTKPFKLEGSKLELNVDAKSGEVVTEVLDAAGQPIPGFTRSEAKPFKVVDELRLVPTWTAQADLGSLQGQVVRLKFHLRNAKLYAFQVKHN